MDILNIILIAGGLSLIVYAMWLKANMMEINERASHHDNLESSHYSISHQARRKEK